MPKRETLEFPPLPAIRVVRAKTIQHREDEALDIIKVWQRNLEEVAREMLSSSRHCVGWPVHKNQYEEIFLAFKARRRNGDELAERDLLGYACCGLDEEEEEGQKVYYGYLYYLCVHPIYRGKHQVGPALLEAFEKHYEGQGVRMFRLAPLIRAIPFYKRQGYTREGGYMCKRLVHPMTLRPRTNKIPL